MKVFLLMGCLISFSTHLIGQNLKVNQAETYFKEFRFADATPIYKELIQKDQISIIEFETVYRHAVIAAEKSHDYLFEYDILAKLSASEKYTFDDAFNYFQMSLFMGYYDRANQIVINPVVKNSTDPRKAILDKYKEGAIWADFSKDTTVYTIKKSEFNSGKGDFNPIYHPKGIVFSSSRDLTFRKSTLDNLAYLNLYLYSIADGKTEEVKFLETNRHDGTAYYDSTNQVWYYSKNLPSNKSVNVTTTGIFIYDEKTKTETAFTYNDANYFFAQPFLSENGLTLWFTSDKIGGLGKSDIWYCNKLVGGGWSEPVNAGNVINTSENEMFPFSQKNKLYFSSNGHVGLGGLDIFSVNFTNNTASDLKNAGVNLNSNADDFSIVLDKTGKTGYFASNREEFIDNIYSVVINALDFIVKGTLVTSINDKVKVEEIPVVVRQNNVVIDTLYADKDGQFEFTAAKNSEYTFEINQNEFVPITEKYSTVGKTESDTTYKTFDLQSRFVDVTTTVLDDRTKQPLANTKVEFTNKTTGEKITLVSDEKGIVQTKLPRNNEFDLLATHNGYINNPGTLSTQSKEKEITTSIVMKKIEIGSLLVVNRLNYDYDKSNLKPDSKLELDKVVLFLKENPSVKIEFSSYTDSRGTDAYNLNLSKRRNQSAVNYLISKGIKKNRIIGKWYGESVLVNNCKNDVNCSEEEHAVNRRTEIKIVSIVDEN